MKSAQELEGLIIGVAATAMICYLYQPSFRSNSTLARQSNGGGMVCIYSFSKLLIMSQVSVEGSRNGSFGPLGTQPPINRSLHKKFELLHPLLLPLIFSHSLLSISNIIEDMFIKIKKIEQIIKKLYTKSTKFPNMKAANELHLLQIWT